MRHTARLKITPPCVSPITDRQRSFAIVPAFSGDRLTPRAESESSPHAHGGRILDTAERTVGDLFADREGYRCRSLHPVLRVQCERWSEHDGDHRFEVRWQ